MSKLKRFILPAMLIAAVILIGCSSDDPVTVGTADTTPPGIAGVTAIDQSHLDVEFSERVQSASAQQSDNFFIVETAKAPDDTTWVGSAVLDSDEKTVHLTTQTPMGVLPYELHIMGVQDVSGNVIETGAMSSFTGSQDPDVTAPTIVDHTPGAGQTDVGVGQSVQVQFSEPMDYPTILSAFSWETGGTQVPHEVDTDDGNIFIFSALRALETSTTYTVTIDGTARDWAGNPLATTTWSFTTTGVSDMTPPTLTSSTPANNDTNVPLGSNLVLVFSEAVDQTSMEEVLVSPDIGEGDAVWSNGGRTVTFNPYVDMMVGTTYNLLIPPGGVKDLAGNGIVDLVQIVWSTGSSLESGSFSGTISGPGSADAANPDGAIVLAADRDPFGEDDDFAVLGTGTANAQGDYMVANLADGTVWPACFLNTNNDGEIDPSYGDAIGAYGISFDPMSGEPRSIVISDGGPLSDIDFAIYDPMAFAGNFNYVGTQYPGCCYQFFVGLFDTAGFDINDPGEPVLGTYGENWPGDGQWTLSELDDGLEAGTYYVGAYLDGNNNGRLDAGDPAGFIGGMNPIPFTVADGSDQLGLLITVDDGDPGFTPWSSWPVRQIEGDGKDKLRRLVRAYKQSLVK